MYIPTEEQRIKVYKQLQLQDQGKDQDKENNPYLSNISISNSNLSSGILGTAREISNHKNNDCVRMSKQQLSALICRLSTNTKREYLIKDHIDKISSINIQRKKANQTQGKVEQRLLEAGKMLQQKKQKLKKEHEQKQQALLKQIPTVSECTQLKVSAPFVQRIEEITQNREQLRTKLNLKYEPTFKPQLNPHSLFIAEVKSDEPFLARVGEYLEKKRSKQDQMAKQRDEAELRQATFQPEINDKSKRIARNSQSSLRGKSTKGHRTPHNNQQFDHMPKINKKSRILAKQNTQKQFHERLYDDMRKMKAKQLHLLREETHKNTHRPNINANSIRIMEAKGAGEKRKMFEDEDMEYEEVTYDGRGLFDHQELQTCLSQEKSESVREQYEEIKFCAQSTNSRPSVKSLILYPKMSR